MSKQIICSGAFKPNSKKLWITWSILDACNYSCIYCPIKSNKYASRGILDETIVYINNINRSNKGRRVNIEVTLFGGEPTLHKDLEYIIKSLSSKNKVRVFTNLSANSSLYKNLYSKYNVQYSISYHPDQINSDKFISKLSKIDKESIGFINVMKIDKYEIDILKVLEYLRENRITYRICPIHGIGNKSEFLQSIIYNNKYHTNFYDTEIVYDTGERKSYTEQELRFYNLTSFKGYICYKGYSSFFINHDGKIYKCLQDMKKDSIYSIKSPYSEIFSIEKSCPYDTCMCESYIPKEIKNGYCNTYLSGIQ